MSRTLKDVFEVYKPKSKDEQNFVDKHVTIKHKDRNGNGDETFKGKTKYHKRSESRKGYDAGADEAVYEEVEHDCPKCERELSSDNHCSHCDHYVDKKGNITYNESWTPDKIDSLLENAFEKIEDGLTEEQLDEAQMIADQLIEEFEDLDEDEAYSIAVASVVGVDLDEEVEELGESLISGTRLVSKHEGKNGHHAEIRYNKDWEEYSVHHYRNGKHLGEGPVSYHSDKSEAKDQVSHDVEHFKESVDQIDEISRETKRNYVRAADADVSKRLKTAETDKEYDKIYNRERHMEKAANDVKGHLTHYKMKSVPGLYSHSHWQHPDGSFAQRRVDGRGPWIHQDKNGKRTEHKDTEALIQHVNKLHEGVDQIDELSKKTLGNYIKSANAKSNDAARTSTYYSNWQHDKDPDIRTKGHSEVDRGEKIIAKRRKGIRMAVNKLTKEDIINRAIDRFLPEDFQPAPIEERLLRKLEGLSESNINSLMDLFVSLNSNNQQIMFDECSTQEGINKLLDMVIESRGQLDELSKKTMGNYIKKAKGDIRYAGKTYVRARQDDDDKEKQYADRLARKRYKGVNMAVDKLTKEEVEDLDEVSDNKMKDYLDKTNPSNGGFDGLSRDKWKKRMAGRDTAKSRLKNKEDSE